MRRCTGLSRQRAGTVLALCGVLIVFLCLPAEFFVILLGAAMTAAGLFLLR